MTEREKRYTPGPWRVGDTEDKENFLQKPIWSDERRAVVAYVVGSTNPMLDWYSGAYNYHVNAHIIAAAPELLEALEAIMENDGTMMRPNCIDKARDAIAKAYGDTP